MRSFFVGVWCKVHNFLLRKGIIKNDQDLMDECSKITREYRISNETEIEAIEKKYLEISRKANLTGKSLASTDCEYCKTSLERNKYHPNTCANCGAEIKEHKPILCHFHRVPVFDRDDYDIILSNHPNPYPVSSLRERLNK